MSDSVKLRHKLLPSLVMFWLIGYFFFPTNKMHYQVFIVTFVLGGLWVAFREKFNVKLIFQSKILLSVFLFALYYLSSLFWPVGTPIDDRIGEAKSVIYLILFGFLIFFSMRHKQDFLPQLLKYGFLAAVGSLLLSCIMFYLVNEQSFSQRLHGYGRLWSPLWMAALYGGVAITALGLLSHQTKKVSTTNTCLLTLVLALAVFAVIATHSRTAIVMTLLVLFLTFLSGKLSLSYKLSLSIFAVVLFLVIAFLSFPHFEADLQRGQSFRLDIWMGALELVKQAPIFGYGAGSDTPISSTISTVDGWHYYHSTYIATLVDLGLVGLGLQIFILVVTFNVAWQLREDLKVRVSAFILFFSCLISLTFGEGIISRMNVQWLLMWLPIMLIAYAEIDKTNNLE